MKTERKVNLYKYIKIGVATASIAIPLAMAIAAGTPKSPPPFSPF
ncbi:MAG: hypothetical protein QXT53_06715 [Ignisphaera sp.]